MSGVGAGRDRPICLEWERVEIGLYVWSGSGYMCGVGAGRDRSICLEWERVYVWSGSG